MKLTKSLACLLALGVSSASFAGYVTFYNKSADKMNMGYKICTWNNDDPTQWVLDCPDHLTWLSTFIDRNGEATVNVDLNNSQVLYVYKVKAVPTPKTRFTKEFSTYEMNGAQITYCGAGSGGYANVGLTFTAVNDAQDVTCFNSTGSHK